MTPPLARVLVIASLALAAAAAPTRAQTVQRDTVVLSLSEAITHALRVSPEVGAERAGENFADARRRLARASRFLTEFKATSAHAVAPGLSIPEGNPFPDHALYLNPDVRNDWENLRPFNRVEVELTQPILTWGQLGGNIRAARHGVAVERADVDEKELEVALRTGELYYGLMLTEALVRLADQAGSVVERAKREVVRLMDEGAEDVDYADLVRVQITEQEYNRRVTEVIRRRMTARSALSRQLFLPSGVVATADADVLEPVNFQRDSLQVYHEFGLANRPEIAKAAAGVAARSELVRVAQSDYYPKLFMAASARLSGAAGRRRQPNPYVGDPFVGRSVRAGFGFQQSLNFAQTRARVAQAEAERDQVRNQQAAARQLVLFEIEDAYNNVVIAESAFEAQTEALRLSQEWLQTESINFDLDLGDTQNLIEAVQANLELEAAYFEAIYRYNVSVLRLLAAAGILDHAARSGTLVDELR